MSTKEYISFSELELTSQIPSVKIGKSNFHGPYWSLEFVANTTPMKIFGDIGFQISIEQENYQLDLWKLNDEIQNLSKTSTQNIKRQIYILSLELSKSRSALINKLNGQIKLTNEYSVIPLSPFNQELAEKFKPDIRKYETGFCWYTFKNIKYDDQDITIAICTKERKTVSVQIHPHHKNTDEKNTWDSWSKKHELETIATNEEWLLKEVGRNRYYPWGIITNNYDEKSGFTSININYEMKNGD